MDPCESVPHPRLRRGWGTTPEYMHKNPITRGLVERADEWKWGSYRYDEHDDAGMIAMDWDDSWPMV